MNLSGNGTYENIILFGSVVLCLNAGAALTTYLLPQS
jgi:hypothetical protein